MLKMLGGRTCDKEVLGIGTMKNLKTDNLNILNALRENNSQDTFKASKAELSRHLYPWWNKVAKKLLKQSVT